MVQEQKDDYYMGIAKAVAEGSTCYLYKEGAILVNPEGSVIASSYNGAVDGCIDCWNNQQCTYARETGNISNCSQEQCMGLCAETNVLLSAGKDRTHDSVLYVYAADRKTGQSLPVHIDGVTGHMIQACRVSRVVTDKVVDEDDDT